MHAPMDIKESLLNIQKYKVKKILLFIQISFDSSFKDSTFILINESLQELQIHM